MSTTRTVDPPAPPQAAVRNGSRNDGPANGHAGVATAVRAAVGATDGGGDRSGDAPPLLFEIAWEVCNQIGGIYQVLRSKVPAMNARWGDRYCLVGPDNLGSALLEFEPAPPDGRLAEALEALAGKLRG